MRFRWSAVAFLALSLCHSPIWAQFQGGGNQGGGFGGNQGGGFGGNLGGGTAGLSGTTGSASGLGGSSTSSQPISPFGSNTAANIFGGFNRTPQGFNVPLNAGATGGAAGAAGRTGAMGGGLGGLGGLGGIGGRGGIGGLGGFALGNQRNRNGGFGMNNQNNNNNQQNKVRAVATLGFDRPSLSSSTASANVQSRMSRLPLPPQIQNVQVSLDGETVVIRGQVPNESDKKLVERLVRLEPGVNSIRNELTTQTSPSEEIQGLKSR